MAIWFSDLKLEHIVNRGTSTLVEHLGIRFTEVGPDYLRATMPVDDRTRQIMGVLHGGASAALAETIGSFAANLCVDQKRVMCVGQEINANHLRPVSSGIVTATARPFHIGARSQVWHIEIHDERERLVCVSRLTMAVVERRENGNGG
jgi:1,4-dihydroxy-2-naphthoyl-CoA hydrolase